MVMEAVKTTEASVRDQEGTKNQKLSNSPKSETAEPS